LVFLAISCSQDVLAITTQDLLGTPSFATTTPVNGVTLNVKAANSTTNTPLYNKIFYSTTAAAANSLATNLATNVPLIWNEKAVFNGSSTADAEIKITATTKVAGDLIVKVDMLTASITSGGAITVSSAWLKYIPGEGPFGSRAIGMVEDGGQVDPNNFPLLLLDKTDLTTLTVADAVAANTTFTFFDFFTKSQLPMHIIITAVLVDDTTADYPQVLGVDVQSIFFNYINPSPAGWAQIRPIWLDLIQTAGTGS